MSVSNIFIKQSLITYKINNQIIRNIDFDDLTTNEIEFLRASGYEVKLFSDNSFKKPYFRIIWRKNYVKSA